MKIAHTPGNVADDGPKAARIGASTGRSASARRSRRPHGVETRALAGAPRSWTPLAAQPGDHVVRKHRYSRFFETELDELLRSLGIRDLLVSGCTTSVCVGSTVRDGMFRDYSCPVLEDCTAEPIGAGLARSNHERR